MEVWGIGEGRGCYYHIVFILSSIFQILVFHRLSLNSSIEACITDGGFLDH